MKIDKDWLFARTNIRRLIQAADDAAESEYTPEDLKRLFIQLENLAQDIDRALRKYE